jgi:putative DNA primase/helicase
MLAHNDDEYDVNPWLLNCTNGTLDLRLGGASFVDDGHNRADKITMLAGAPYYERLFNPHLVATPLWDAFLHRIFAGDDDLIAFVWRAIGYSLTGVASEQCLFLCHGVGKNGKSTLITAIREMLGDYAANIAPATLTTKRDGGASGDLARLRGVRMVSCEETEGNQRINESLVKQLTGGGRLTARRLYKSEIEFEPVAKIWFATNHRPDIRGRDVGIWRRIRLIPFKVQIPEAERDGELPAKLRREYPGIMSRAVEACADWQRGGLRPPACVVAATESYSQYQDVIGSWVDECCVVSSLASEKIGALYESFCAWAKASGEEPKSKKAFAAELIDRGHESTRGAHGVRRMSGIGLLAKDEHAAHAERS